nr:MAG TPA: Catabolite control protein A [Caudoviricetes sp.]
MAEKKKQNWNSICNINGVKMSVTQRNKIMKNKYIYEDISLQDLAKEFNMSYQTVRCMSSKEKWKDEKDKIVAQLKEDIDKQVYDVYLAAGVDINMQYHALWQQLYTKATHMLETEEGLINVKTGKLDVYRLNQLADVIAKAQQGQQFTSGLLSKEIQVDVDIKKERLELDRDKFELQKQLLGVNDEQVVDTNSLLRALNGVAAAVGIGEE